MMFHALPSKIITYVALVLLTAAVTVDAVAEAPSSVNGPSPTTLLRLRPGEKGSVVLSWPANTGRMPVVFVSEHKELSWEQTRIFPDEDAVLYSADGLSLRNERLSPKLLEGVLVNRAETARDEGTHRRSPDFVVALRLDVEDQSVSRIHTLYVHVVSGTSRMMRLSAKIGVLVDAD